MNGLNNLMNADLTVLTVNCADAEIFLSGMQPQEAGIEFTKMHQCRMYQAYTKDGNADPFLS